jgi:hypothetical protein
MPTLDDAMPGARTSNPDRPRREPITVGIGRHPGVFCGFSAKKWKQTAFYDENNTEGKERPVCGLCKGKGTGPRGESGQCVACNGTGDKIETRANMIFDVYDEVINVEVNYIISAPWSPDGKRQVPGSKPFEWLLAISRLAENSDKLITSEDINAWYSKLSEPVRVPCWVRVAPHRTKAGQVFVKDIEARDLSEPIPQRAPQVERPVATNGAALHGNGNAAVTEHTQTVQSPAGRPASAARRPGATQSSSFGPVEARKSTTLFTGTSKVFKNDNPSIPAEFVDGRHVHMYEPDFYLVSIPGTDEYDPNEPANSAPDYEWVSKTIFGKPLDPPRLLRKPLPGEKPRLVSDEPTS